MTEYFNLVEHRPDFQISIATEEEGAAHGLAAGGPEYAFLQQAKTGRAAQVVFFNGDRWDGSTDWHSRFRAFVAETDTIVFGPQLPVSSPFGDRLHPLLYPSTIASVRPKTPSTHDIDLIFVGDFADESDPDDYPEPLLAGADLNSRSRHSRAQAINLIRRELGHRRLLIERRSFWEFRRDAGTADIARVMVSYQRALMRASVCFSPPGKGYNCVRHSDILAVGGLMLTPPIHEYVRVPEPSVWASEEICVLYAMDGGNLVETADRAIASAASLQTRRDAARAYYERFGTARARARCIASVLAAS